MQTRFAQVLGSGSELLIRCEKLARSMLPPVKSYSVIRVLAIIEAKSVNCLVFFVDGIIVQGMVWALTLIKIKHFD